MKVMILDTETATNFAPNYAKWYKEPALFPKIAQISWLITDISVQFDNNKKFYTSKILKTRDFYVYPKDGEKEYTVTDDTFKIHKISTKILKEKGKSIDSILHLLLHDANNCKYIVGHNIYFDTSNILAASEIAGINNTVLSFDKPTDIPTILYGGNKGRMYKVINKNKRICTMMKSTSYCKIPHPKYKGYKWPKLCELYKFLFKTSFEGAHSALEDIKATNRCFIELLNKNIIHI